MIEIKNLPKFEKNLRLVSKKLGIPVQTAVKKLAFDIFGDVVAGTPVDTGRAMNNWNISVGSPDHTTTEAGGKKTSVRNSKKVEGLTTLANFAVGQTVWISNSVDYIMYLEEGHSRQAPNGWVVRAVLNNINALKNARI